jgi:hypothetical protein
MNFGTVSLAAPQAASSRVSRYSSRTDRRVLAMASQSTSSDPAAERCLLASAAIRLASTAKASPSTSAGPRSQTAFAADCNHGSGHAYSWRSRRGRADRTNGRRGSGAPPHTTAVRNDAVAVADQQHPDQQFGIDRRPASRAVKIAPSGSERLTNRLGSFNPLLPRLCCKTPFDANREP